MDHAQASVIKVAKRYWRSVNGNRNFPFRKVLIRNQTKLLLCVLLVLTEGTPHAWTQTPTVIDASFNPGSGANGDIFNLALQADRKILIAGQFTAFNNTNRNRIARLNPDGSLDADFDPGLGADGDVYAVALQPVRSLG